MPLISGHALNSDNTPVALVEATAWGDSVVVTSVVPDGTGHWTLDLAEGAYAIRYVSPGFDTRTFGPVSVSDLETFPGGSLPDEVWDHIQITNGNPHGTTYDLVGAAPAVHYHPEYITGTVFNNHLVANNPHGITLSSLGGAPLSHTHSEFSNFVTKIAGKSLSTEDFTTELKTKLETLPNEFGEGTVKSVQSVLPGIDGNVSLTGIFVETIAGMGLSQENFTPAYKNILDNIGSYTGGDHNVDGGSATSVFTASELFDGGGASG